MNTRTRVAIGGTAALALAASLVLGTLPGGGRPGGIGGPPRAAAVEGLVPFEDCGELLAWYVDKALPQVTAYGFGGGPYWGGPIAQLEGRADMAGGVRDTATNERSLSTSAKSAYSVGNGETGTNVQEAGVDEPDVAKTDGRYVYRVNPQRRAVAVFDTDGGAPRKVGEVDLPKQMYDAELLLVGDRLQVISTIYGGWFGGGDVVIDSKMPYPGPAADLTRVLEVDVSDPSSPSVVADREYGGTLISARQYGDAVRLVISTGLPTLDFVTPNRRRTWREAKAENREIVRESSIEDWLPFVKDADSRSDAPLVDCRDVSHPETDAGFGTLTVVGYRAAESESRSSIAITAGGETVYSSTDELYLATTDYGWQWGWDIPRPLGNGIADEPKEQGPTTTLHAFALEGISATHVASGSFDGAIRDRWSMDAVDGRLRVAAGIGFRRWTARENAVISFAQRGDKLVETGRADGLGRGEEIKSVRFFDDLAIVVTFEQTDPLYTVDVSGPVPTTLGELKIPGFSSYLHPIGDDRLLGLGSATKVVNEFGEEFARTIGAKVSVFDVSDLAAPRQVDKERVGGRETRFLSDEDPRAFTWLPDRSVGLVPMSDWSKGGMTLVSVSVDDRGRLTTGEALRVKGWDWYAVRSLPLDDGRVAVVTSEGVETLRP